MATTYVRKTKVTPGKRSVGRPRKNTATAGVKARGIVSVIAPTIKGTTPPRKPRAKKEKPWVFNVFLLDCSVSMSPKAAATVSGFNEVLQASYSTEVHTENALATFSAAGYETFTMGNIEPFGGKNQYKPIGYSTALYDAIVKTLNKINESILAHGHMPVGTKVVFTIFTDGEENSSRTYNLKDVKDAIERANKNGWVVNFVGAGSDSVIKRMSGEMGIYEQNTMSYANNSVGTRSAFKATADSLSVYNQSVSKGTDSNIGFFSK